METEPQARPYAPVALINREGPYVIIALFGMSILGCASVLVYSFNNYAKLKRSAEELRNRISDSQTKAADRQSVGGARSGVVDAGATVKGAPTTPVADAGNQPSVDADAQNRSDASVSHGTNPATAALSILTANSTNATGDSFADAQ